ncbi:hypothetical protein RJ639_008720 [Escallonia herrerae]|uniref:Transposase Tnp1/En/Spm-like domain-containing protein n=1 Tax=Escallonia herrerae TaxID=1293975 RepID=A0AA88VTG2_9ASTE|nr:hypothetical protein RJ639_008720 [Escallonia herrerae]
MIVKSNAKLYGPGISEKNKANQNQKKLVQTTGKESYALIRERKAQMHEKKEKLPESSQDLPAENDILAQVVGKDKYGRVRMYGLGVSQSDVRDVCLKSIMSPSETVAKGIIQSVDPSTQVGGGEELGPNWCKVSVQVAVKKDERLIRFYGFYKTIYDAYGATIVWQCPYVCGNVAMKCNNEE